MDANIGKQGIYHSDSAHATNVHTPSRSPSIIILVILSWLEA